MANSDVNLKVSFAAGNASKFLMYLRLLSNIIVRLFMQHHTLLSENLPFRDWPSVLLLQMEVSTQPSFYLLCDMSQFLVGAI
jgi:hypothetical protein